MKFRPLTTKPKKKDINLLTGKAVRRKKKDKNNPKDMYIKENQDTYIPSNIEENAGIFSNISHLPTDVQKLINNSTIKGIKTSNKGSVYTLANGLIIEITQEVVRSRNKTRIIVKDKRKTLIDTKNKL